jgi:hypothetical protein
MRSVLLSALVLLIAAAGACGKSEKPGAAETTASAPAATPDPHPPFGMFNTPGEGETVPNKTWCTGWALDDSGITQVTGTTDTGALAPAKIDQPFPGVKEAYPNIAGNETAGFIFQIPDLPPGPHSIKLEIVAKDGGRATITRNFKVQ